MLKAPECLQLAALLHDIGKFRMRQKQPNKRHQEHSYEFVNEDFVDFFSPCDGIFRNAIRHHHPERFPNVDPTQLKHLIEKQVILADRLSASEREDEEREREYFGKSPLVSIMSRLKASGEEYRYPLTLLNIERDTIIPTKSVDVGQTEYRELWKAFTSDFRKLADRGSYSPEVYQSVVALLHKYTSRMPSATPWGQSDERAVPDISLYDHLRTTAAIAACIGCELSEDEVNAQLRKSASERKIAALLKGDISGIQKFLYQLKSEGASRELRGRSFYLQQLTEAIALWVLRQFDLPITNLLLASGGHFYLLVPYGQAREKIDALRAEIAEKLWGAHREELSIILAEVPVAANNFEAFSSRWDSVSQETNRRKQTKWRELPKEKMFDLFFTPGSEWKPNYGFPELGRQLRDTKYLVAFEIPEQPIADKPDWREIISSFGLEVHLLKTSEEKLTRPAAATRATVYRLDSADFLSDEILESFRWENLPVSYDFRLLPQVIPRETDSDEVADFSQLADASEGAKWLGVLRMDVDNLGGLFKDGLGESATISRMSTLSESLRLFFEGYVPKLCRNYNDDPHTPEEILELIYAGGDDLFLVGGWSALPQIAQQIRDEFRAFVGGEHVTLSGGIAVKHQKYPLYQLANDAGTALDNHAKTLRKEKDALSFLQKPMTWKQFNRVSEWHKRLFAAVDGEKPLPSGFLKRLTEIYQLYKSDKHNQCKWTWQLIYHLSRAKQMYKNHTDLIDDLRQELVRNHSQERELLQFLHVIARWTTLRKRED